MATAREVAQWLLDAVRAQDGLIYWDAVDEIVERFGEEFAPTTRPRSRAISKEVLKEFRRLHGGTVEWSRADKIWWVKRHS